MVVWDFSHQQYLSLKPRAGTQMIFLGKFHCDRLNPPGWENPPNRDDCEGIPPSVALNSGLGTIVICLDLQAEAHVRTKSVFQELIFPV